MKDRIAAEAFPVWSYVHEEMLERGWDKQELAIHMGGDDMSDIAVNVLTLDLMETIRDPNAIIGDKTAERLSRAFGVSAQFFTNLDNAYRLWRKVTLGKIETE